MRIKTTTKMSARRGYNGKNLNKESLVEGEAKEGKGFGAREEDWLGSSTARWQQRELLNSGEQSSTENSRER